MSTDPGRASTTGAEWEHLPLGIYLEIDTYADLLREGAAVAE